MTTVFRPFGTESHFREEQTNDHFELNFGVSFSVIVYESMFCTKCGQQLREGSNFCSQCGRSTGPEAAASRTAPAERLVRIRSDKKIAGVCAGFARYMGVDVTLVRVVWLVIAFTAGVGFIAYIVAWIAMPLEDAPLGSSTDMVARDYGSPSS